MQIPLSTSLYAACRKNTRVELDHKIGVHAITVLLQHDLLSDPGSHFKERKKAIDTELNDLPKSVHAEVEKDQSVKPEDLILFELLHRMKTLLP